MKESVRNLLLVLLHSKIIVASWGISNISICENEVIFSVCGFKFCGRVHILVQDSGYQIILKGGAADTQEQVFFATAANLVELLDFHIERTDNYLQDISNSLHS